jgi:hypothetical protein
MEKIATLEWNNNKPTAEFYVVHGDGVKELFDTHEHFTNEEHFERWMDTTRDAYLGLSNGITLRVGA